MGTKAYIVRACIRYRDLQPYENTRQPAATGAPAAPPRGCAPPPPPWPQGPPPPPPLPLPPSPRQTPCPYTRPRPRGPTPAGPRGYGHPALPQRDADAAERSSGIPTMRSESLSELAALRKGNVDGRLGPRQVLLQRAPLTRPRGRCRRRRSPTGAPNQIRILRASRIR